MLRKNLNRVLYTLVASVLAIGLMAQAGCDDGECEGPDCFSPVTGEDEGPDAAVVGPECELMCTHLVVDCGDNTRAAPGSGVNPQCALFCEGLGDEVRGCLTTAPCENLGICLEDDTIPPFDGEPTP